MAFKGDLDALILGVLEIEELHGYEISKRIKRLSEQALDIGEGQLYPALHILERSGLVTAKWVPNEGKPPRKVYEITDAGRATLAEKRKEWKLFTAGVGAILNPAKLAHNWSSLTAAGRGILQNAEGVQEVSERVARSGALPLTGFTCTPRTPKGFHWNVVQTPMSQIIRSAKLAAGGYRG